MAARHEPRTRLIDEPSTTITDYAIAITSTACAVLLVQQGETTAVQLLSVAAFATLSLSAACGGTSHGFGVRLTPQRARLVWTASLLCAQAASLLLACAVFFARLPAPAAAVVIAALVMKTAPFAVRIVRAPRFAVMASDAALSLGLIALVEAAAWLRGDAASAPWLLAAIAITAAGVAVQQSGRGLHRALNHNDLMHVAQLVATWLFYRGIAQLTTG
jgi:hypothetical protein